MQDRNPCLQSDPGTRNLQFMEPTEVLPLEPVGIEKSFSKKNLVSGSTCGLYGLT